MLRCHVARSFGREAELREVLKRVVVAAVAPVVAAEPSHPDAVENSSPMQGSGCPLLALSGHAHRSCECPLMTLSGHWVVSSSAGGSLRRLCSCRRTCSSGPERGRGP